MFYQLFEGHHKFTTGKWNPQRSGPQFATANDTCVRGWDLRVNNKQVWTIEGAHMQLVRYESKDIHIQTKLFYFYTQAVQNNIIIHEI